jgi:hypothetical protein
MAVWVKLTKAYDERVTNRQFKAHQPGAVAFVRQEIADDILAKGMGEVTEAPEGHKTTKSGGVEKTSSDTPKSVSLKGSISGESK